MTYVFDMAQFSNQHMDRSFLEADIPEIVSKLKADELVAAVAMLLRPLRLCCEGSLEIFTG